MRDNRRIQRTYRLQLDTVTAIDRVSKQCRVYPSTLVDLALSHALKQIEAGDLVIDCKPVVWQVTGLRLRVQAE
jgi:hypothetical protein